MSTGDFERVELHVTFDYDPSTPLPADLNCLRAEYESCCEDELRVKHIYAVAGLALYSAQCFEAELQQAILATWRAKGELHSLDDYDALDGRLAKLTLGSLLKEASKVVLINGQASKMLTTALDARNSLTHGFFSRHAEDFFSQAGRQRMLAELLEWIRLFRIADGSLSLITKLLLQAYGVEAADLERIQADMLRKVRDAGA